MSYGGFAFGSAAIGGGIPSIACGTPSANLIVMDQLLKLGYKKEEASKMLNLIQNCV